MNRHSTFAVSCCIRCGWKRNICIQDIWTSPAESHFSGAAVEKAWRTRGKKAKEQMRSEWSCWPLLPSRGLTTRRSPPAVHPSRVSLRPWIKAHTLSMTFHPLWPSFAVNSSIIEACLKHVLFLWYWPYGANVCVQYLATVVHLCVAPEHGGGRPVADFRSTWFFGDLNETPLNNKSKW